MKKIAAVLAVAVIALTACSSERENKQGELGEATYVAFVKKNAGSYQSKEDEEIVEDALDVCTEMDEGVSYDSKASQAQDANDLYEIAVLVGATIWYCEEHDPDAQ